VCLFLTLSEGKEDKKSFFSSNIPLGASREAIVKKITFVMLKSVLESSFPILSGYLFKKCLGPPIIAGLCYKLMLRFSRCTGVFLRKQVREN
jgi:hypothetical protein